MLEGISPLISPQLPEVITPAKRLDMFAFCERAKIAFAIVMTGETARYGNIILVKGVTRV